MLLLLQVFKTNWQKDRIAPDMRLRHSIYMPVHFSSALTAYNAYMWTIATDVVRHVNYVSVCRCVGSTGEVRKNGWTDRDAVLGLTQVSPRSHVLWGPDPISMLPLVSDGEYADGTDWQGQTDGLQTVTLRFALDAAIIKINKIKP